MVITETERPRESSTSKAFNLERREDVTRDELRDDIVSYLGEYRLKLQKYKYNLVFEKGENPKLSDFRRGESMRVKAQRTIREREKIGDPLHREIAEFKGIVSLENQLLDADTNDTVLWISPPGPKDEGYGDYGFIYFGKVIDKNDKKDLEMSAVRIEKPFLDNFNRVASNLTGKKIDFKTAEDFLANPFVIGRDIKEKDLNIELAKVLNFLPSQDDEYMFKGILRRMDKMIEDFLDNPTVKGLYALENIAIQYRKNYDATSLETILYSRNARLSDVIGEYGHLPPKVGGSCGSSATENKSFKSNGILGMGPVLFEDEYGSRAFECPSCHKTNIRPKGELLEKCQHCGSKDVSC